MANEKNLVSEITNMDEDFAQWYTDIVKKAELAEYSIVKGFVILRPYGYAIWELMQQDLDRRFKECGHENVYFPLLITESLLQKEKDHVEGFAPEVAWVTHGGSEELTERMCIRPTSETLFCHHWSQIVQSYNDLPKLYNQWCSVVRWEKTTRPFLRTREFLWQEGHTIHATAKEAIEETERMLNVYADHCVEMLSIPVIKGKKTEKEKFAGADSTYSIESLMHDGKALQAGTSHYFGDNFARAFDITFTDKDGMQKYVHETSWGFSTRMVGAIIMTHGDNNGLVLPPNVAPIQVIIIPIAQHNEGVLEKAEELRKRLLKVTRVKMDSTDKSAGWKFSQYEMKGVPLRLEIGPKDIAKNQAVLVRRDTREKIVVSLDELETKIPELLGLIQKNLYEKAKALRDEKTYVAKTTEEFKEIADTKNGFIKAMWCGDRACEDKIKDEYGISSRNIPFDEEKISDTCICCGKEAKHLLYWGRAY